MKKNIVIGTIMMCMFVLFGCGKVTTTVDSSKVYTINEIKEIPEGKLISAKIKFDGPEQLMLEVTNGEDLDKIMEFYEKREYSKSVTDIPAPGSNAAVVFVYDDGTELYLSCNSISDADGNRYTPGRDELESYLNDLGKAAGVIE